MVEVVEEEVEEVELGAKMVVRWGSWENMRAVGSMGSTATGEEGEMVVILFRQTTPDRGDFLDPPPVSLILHLLEVRSFCLKSRGFGRQVPSSGPKINRGMAV